MQLQATYAKAFEAGKYSPAVRCLELQGKYLKMFSDKIEHVETIDQMSTEELIELLRDVVTNGGLDLEELLGYTGTGTGINSQYFGYKRA